MKFVLIKKQGLNPNIVKITTKAFFDRDYEEILETVDIDALKDAIKVPVQEIDIEVKGKYLTEVLIKAITPAYLRGTQIVVNGIKFPICKSNPQYFYIWQDKVPASLPEHLKEAFYSYKLRGDLYQELVAWNQSRIALATEKSKFKWSFAEDFYKELFKQLKPFGIRVCSPNKKTFYEAMAELDVEAYLKPQNPLTQEEQDFLFQADVNNYIRAFGLQDTSFRIGTHHRTTKHGTTEEPCIISSYDIEMAVTAQSFNRKDNREIEGYVDDEGFEVKSWNSASSSIVVSHQRERENIETLKWFLSLDKETQKEFLLPGWRFCPVCGKLYHELDGCYDGDICHVKEIEVVPYNENHDNDEDEEDYDE